MFILYKILRERNKYKIISTQERQDNVPCYINIPFAYQHLYDIDVPIENNTSLMKHL